MAEIEKPELTARYFLSLSSVASSVSLGGKSIEPNASGGFAGTLEIDKDAPVVFLEVKWKEGAGPRRFAKLVIEAAGQETFTKGFDAPGDMDDFVELPF